MHLSETQSKYLKQLSSERYHTAKTEEGMEAKKNYGYDAIGRLSISSFNCLFREVEYFWNFTLAMSVIVLALSISFLWSIFTFRNLRKIKVEVFLTKEMFTHKIEICVA